MAEVDAEYTLTSSSGTPSSYFLVTGGISSVRRGFAVRLLRIGPCSCVSRAAFGRDRPEETSGDVWMYLVHNHNKFPPQLLSLQHKMQPAPISFSKLTGQNLGAKLKKK